jgi:hypothetical protein
MKATITTISPSSYLVNFETPDMRLEELIGQLPKLERILAGAGYLPNGEMMKSPEGLPICPRHGEVMRAREKQGDAWYSHKVVDPTTGEVAYCKGRPGKDSPGWDVGGNGQAQAKPALPSPSKGEPAPAAPRGPGGQGGGPPAHLQCAICKGDKRTCGHHSVVEVPGDGGISDQDLGAPTPDQAIEDSATAFWTLASNLIAAGQLTHPQAGDIAKQSGTWAEKAARLAVA